jgi:hypothetical protein
VAAEGQKTASEALSATLEAKEAECDSRRELLDRVVQQVASLEKRRMEIEAQTTAAHQDLVERRRKHEEVRRHLEDAFIAARTTANHHRTEAQHHIRRLVAQEEDMTRELQSMQEDLRRLETAKAVLEEKQDAGAVVAVELRIQREVQHQEELVQLVAHEQALLDKYLRKENVTADAAAAAAPNPPTNLASTNKSTPKPRVLSPVPDATM